MTDLYADLERIEERGKRIAKKNNGSDNFTFASRSKPAPEGNGGKIKESGSDSRNTRAELGSEESKPYQRDIYADLENIEKRGKRKKSGGRFFFSRRKGQ